MESDCKSNIKYEILTPFGWSDFDGIKKIKSDKLFEITLSNNLSLKCTNNHKLKTKNGFIECEKLDLNDLIETSNGFAELKSKKQILQEKYVYDLLNVSFENQYYTNNIISHNCEFQGSSGTLISGSKLKTLTSEYPIVENEGLYQFKQPEKDHKYVIICDVSRGKGLDYSAFQLIDVTSMPYIQVCIFRNNAISPVDYAEIIFRTAKAYNNANVMIEINDIGEHVSHELNYTFGYEYLMYTENAGRSGKKVTGGFGSGSSVDKGVRTTKIVKAIGCSVLKLLIESDQLILNDEFSINELKTFSKKRSSYEAEVGKHDDLVMCLVLFAWLTTQEYFKEQTDINTLAGLRDKTDDEIDSDLSPFGFVDSGFDETTVESIPDIIPDGWLWASDF